MRRNMGVDSPKMEGVEAFLFDLDGTLVDTEMVWARAIARFLCDNGAQAPLEEVEKIVFGRSWFDIHRDLKERYPNSKLDTPLADGERLRVYYAEIAADPQSLVIGPNVAFLKKVSGIAPCAIVSGSPRDDVMRAVELCGISGNIRFAMGIEDYGRGKPAPDGFLAAAKALGANPAKCVVVEDSTAGVAAGAAAGMKVIALDNNKVIKQNLSPAVWKVADLSELDPDAVFGSARG